MKPRRAPVIQHLFETLHTTLPYFDSDAATLARSYGAGKWNLRQILLHLSDQETTYLDRLRRIAAERAPVLLNMDENRWAKKLLYAKRDLSLAKLQFECARRNVIELARLLDDRVDALVGTHSTAGPRTFAQILSGAARHNAHHLEQLEAIAAGRKWRPRG